MLGTRGHKYLRNNLHKYLNKKNRIYLKARYHIVNKKYRHEGQEKSQENRRVVRLSFKLVPKT